MARKEIFLEEAVLDDLSRGLEVIERPFSHAALRGLLIVTVAVGCTAVGRVVFLDGLGGAFYRERALANAGQQVIVRAPRGIIYDRFGKSLVSNEPSFSVSLNLSELLREPGSVRHTLEAISSIVPFDVDEGHRSVLEVDLEHQAYFPLARDLSLSQVVALRQLNRREVVVEENFSRRYAEGTIFSHLVGYTGMVSPDDLSRDSALLLNDEIGKSGLEASYDEALRGENGVALVFRDVRGATIDQKTVRDPVAGNSLITAIDGDLQRYFYETLEQQLRVLGRTSGAGLAINPQTGEVLALVSLPSYDNNTLTSDLFVNRLRPTFNRVISGVYSPGSTIKPLVAFGALEEGVIDPLHSILSIGYIEIPNPYNPDKPSRFVDWRPHGWVNLYSALARSSNVYFYEVGGGYEGLKGLGIERLKEYWQKFLVATKTGIDLVGETEGFLPDPATKEMRTGDIWRLGDTYNVSIGQGDLLVSPLALLRSIVGVATRGALVRPFVVRTIKDASGNVVFEHAPSADRMEVKKAESFNEVETGLLDAVRKDYGTAHLLASIPMTIAAKTGSAQIENNQKTNAFFVGYNIPPQEESQMNADKENSQINADKNISENQRLDRRISAPKQIAVLVLIEDAREGSLNAVPVAQKIFEWYYENRIKNAER